MIVFKICGLDLRYDKTACLQLGNLLKITLRPQEHSLRTVKVLPDCAAERIYNKGFILCPWRKDAVVVELLMPGCPAPLSYLVSHKQTPYGV